MKKGLILSFCGISLLIATFVFEDTYAETSLNGNVLYVGGSGPNNYTKIQDAIDDAMPGDTIFVYSGIYYENIVIEKSINLVGEHLSTTTIIGNGTETVWMVKDNACINGFTIKNTKDEGAGIRITWDNHIITNCDISNTKYGILITSSSFNIITNCTLRHNYYGIIITGCKCARGSYNSLIYRNNFINNHIQARDEWSNVWNSGKIGNYWSDYTGKDENNDGIGDVPYNISGGFNKDYAPLIKPIDVIPPIVRVIFPNGGEIVAGDVTIEWNVSDNCDLNPKIDIEYRVGNGIWHAIATGLYNTTKYTWDVSSLPAEKNYSIRITATDISGNRGSDVSDGTFTIILPPNLEFITPKKGYFYFKNREIFPLPKDITLCIGSISIKVNAFSEIGIEKVAFYLDENLITIAINEPYGWLLDERIFGKHEIKAVAYDNAGNTASNEMEIWIFNS